MQEAGPQANRESALPSGRGRLGASFAKLWLAQGVSNLGDGVYLTALPLLAATLTRDPFTVSAVMFAEWLPWLLFGLVAGALLDRWDRQRVMWTVDAARLVAVGGLAAAVLTGWASIPLLLLTGFLLGTGRAPPPGRRTSLRADIAEGLRWLFAHRVLRAMAGLVAGVNIAWTGSDAIMVLFAQEVLGLGSVGFGLLLTGSAVGGVAGSVVAPRLSRRLGPVPVMTGGFIVAGIASVGIGLTHNPWVAGGLLARASGSAW
jgi:MFS family permease